MAGAALDHLLKPSAPLKVCPFCAVPANWRFDKKGRPFHYCGDCGARVFIYTIRGLIGFELYHQMIVRSGVVRHRNLVHRLTGQRMRVPSRGIPRSVAVAR